MSEVYIVSVLIFKNRIFVHGKATSTCHSNAMLQSQGSHYHLPQLDPISLLRIRLIIICSISTPASLVVRLCGFLEGGGRRVENVVEEGKGRSALRNYGGGWGGMVGKNCLPITNSFHPKGSVTLANREEKRNE